MVEKPLAGLLYQENLWTKYLKVVAGRVAEEQHQEEVVEEKNPSVVGRDDEDGALFDSSTSKYEDEIDGDKRAGAGMGTKRIGKGKKTREKGDDKEKLKEGKDRDK